MEMTWFMFGIQEKDRNAPAPADIDCEAARWLADQGMRTSIMPQNSSPFKR